MPIYEYGCSCGHEFEVARPADECSLPQECLMCGKMAERAFKSAPQAIIRGGWTEKAPLVTTMAPGTNVRGRASREAKQTRRNEELWRGIKAASRMSKKPEDGMRVIASMSQMTANALNKKTGGALFGPDMENVLRESGAIFDHEKT